MTDIVMSREIRDLWVTALESGRYEQGFGHLKKGLAAKRDGHVQHCCLGVLCELAFLNGVGVTVTLTGPVDEPHTPKDARPMGWNGHYRFLPPAVKVWAGVSDGLENDLVMANDTARSGECYGEVIDVLKSQTVIDEPSRGLVSQ